MNMTPRLWLMIFIAMTGVTQAKPFIPEDDHQVLERLPEQIFQSTTSAKIKLLVSGGLINP